MSQITLDFLKKKIIRVNWLRILNIYISGSLHKVQTITKPDGKLEQVSAKIEIKESLSLKLAVKTANIPSLESKDSPEKQLKQKSKVNAKTEGKESPPLKLTVKTANIPSLESKDLAEKELKQKSKVNPKTGIKESPPLKLTVKTANIASLESNNLAEKEVEQKSKDIAEKEREHPEHDIRDSVNEDKELHVGEALEVGHNDKEPDGTMNEKIDKKPSPRTHENETHPEEIRNNIPDELNNCNQRFVFFLLFCMEIYYYERSFITSLSMKPIYIYVCINSYSLASLLLEPIFQSVMTLTLIFHGQF